MAQPSSRPRPNGKPKKNGFTRHQPPSQTKFDIWLEQHLNSGETITFMFKNHPFSGNEFLPMTGTVITVDRYHVFLDFGDDQIWVAKDNIISAQ